MLGDAARCQQPSATSPVWQPAAPVRSRPLTLRGTRHDRVRCCHLGTRDVLGLFLFDAAGAVRNHFRTRGTEGECSQYESV